MAVSFARAGDGREVTVTCGIYVQHPGDVLIKVDSEGGPVLIQLLPAAAMPEVFRVQKISLDDGAVVVLAAPGETVCDGKEVLVIRRAESVTLVS